MQLTAAVSDVPAGRGRPMCRGRHQPWVVGIAAALAISGCVMESDPWADVHNATGRPVVIENVAPDGHPYAEQTLAPDALGRSG